MNIRPIHPDDLAEHVPANVPNASRVTPSRRTFGRYAPSRRTFGRYAPSRRTFGRRAP